MNLLVNAINKAERISYPSGTYVPNAFPHLSHVAYAYANSDVEIQTNPLKALFEAKLKSYHFQHLITKDDIYVVLDRNQEKLDRLVDLLAPHVVAFSYQLQVTPTTVEHTHVFCGKGRGSPSEDRKWHLRVYTKKDDNPLTTENLEAIGLNRQYDMRHWREPFRRIATLHQS